MTRRKTRTGLFVLTDTAPHGSPEAEAAQRDALDLSFLQYFQCDLHEAGPHRLRGDVPGRHGQPAEKGAHVRNPERRVHCSEARRVVAAVAGEGEAGPDRALVHAELPGAEAERTARLVRGVEGGVEMDARQAPPRAGGLDRANGRFDAVRWEARTLADVPRDVAATRGCVVRGASGGHQVADAIDERRQASAAGRALPVVARVAQGHTAAGANEIHGAVLDDAPRDGPLTRAHLAPTRGPARHRHERPPRAAQPPERG